MEICNPTFRLQLSKNETIVKIEPVPEHQNQWGIKLRRLQISKQQKMPWARIYRKANHMVVCMQMGLQSKRNCWQKSARGKTFLVLVTGTAVIKTVHWENKDYRIYIHGLFYFSIVKTLYMRGDLHRKKHITSQKEMQDSTTTYKVSFWSCFVHFSFLYESMV